MYNPSSKCSGFWDISIRSHKGNWCWSSVVSGERSQRAQSRSSRKVGGWNKKLQCWKGFWENWIYSRNDKSVEEKHIEGQILGSFLWLLMHSSAEDIMRVQVGDGCDLTVCFSVGMMQRAFSQQKNRWAKVHEERPRHLRVSLFAVCFLTTRSSKSHKAELLGGGWPVGGTWIFGVMNVAVLSPSVRSTFHPGNAAKKKKKKNYQPTQRKTLALVIHNASLDFPVAMCTPCGPSEWMND